jgi:hypothetical protein
LGEKNSFLRKATSVAAAAPDCGVKSKCKARVLETLMLLTATPIPPSDDDADDTEEAAAPRRW